MNAVVSCEQPSIYTVPRSIPFFLRLFYGFYLLRADHVWHRLPAD